MRRAGRRVLVLALLGACTSAEVMPIEVRVRHGALTRAPRRLIASPASCGSLGLYLRKTAEGTTVAADEPGYAEGDAGDASGDAGDATGDPTDATGDPGDGSTRLTGNIGRPECMAADLAIVDGTVRTTLELAGLDVVDSERVVAATLAHTATERADGGGSSVLRERRGARFADAPPAQQRAIVAALGADGMVSTRVWVGASVGMGLRATVEVQVRVVDAATGALAWVRRCAVELAGLTTEAAAMQRAARCAAGARDR